MTQSPKISLAHGDGGMITLALIKEEILSRFDNPSLKPLEDGSWVDLPSSQIVVSTDSYIVDPPIFPGGDIGKLAVSGTVNDLIASGAVPRYLSLSLIIAVGFPFDRFLQILDSIQESAQYAGVEIIAGDTKVLDKVSPESIFINTAGFGTPLIPHKDFAVSNAKVGDKIIITGTIGDHSLAVLSLREGLGFEQRVQSDCNPLNELLLPILQTYDGIHVLRDPTRGGLLGVLADICEASACDLVIEEQDIPVQHEVRFGCEMLGLDPCTLVNEGKMVIVADPSQSEEIVRKLRHHPLGKRSAVIGVVQEPKESGSKLLFHSERKLRVVQRPKSSMLPRLC